VVECAQLREVESMSIEGCCAGALESEFSRFREGFERLQRRRIIFSFFRLSYPRCHPCFYVIQTIRSHLAALYDTLLEQISCGSPSPIRSWGSSMSCSKVGRADNPLKRSVYSPSSRSMAVDHLLLLVRRLSGLILDNVSHGVLDQGRRCFLEFDKLKAHVSAVFLLTLLI
jgi:hypothetical protein